MAINNLNFANPAWLWALIVIPIGFLWYKYIAKRHDSKQLSTFIDDNLLPHILLKSGSKGSKHFNWLYLFLLIFIIISLANPRWSYTEVEGYQPTASLVILFDLSDSNDVNAVRQQVEDLINNSKGLKVGLIAYAGVAHIISPVTDDLQTIRNYLPALDTDLVTRQGDNLPAALSLADELLSHELGKNKSVLLVSNGTFAHKNLQAQLNKLQDDDIAFYVLGVGSANKKNLQDIAKQGRGYYMTADHSEYAIKTILGKIKQRGIADELVAGKVRHWQDRYYIFLIPAALVFLYLFKQGALLLVLLCLFVPDIHAKELFKNDDQQALEYYKSADFTTAAEMFSGSYNKGVSLYRAGDYIEAERMFKLGHTIDATYNSGNAQMQQQKWQDAIASYEAVLDQEPNHADAKHNLAIAKKMLEQADQQQEQQEDMQQQDEDNSESKEDNTDSEKQEKDDLKQQAEDQKEQQDNKQEENSANSQPEDDNFQDQEHMPEDKVGEDDSKLDNATEASQEKNDADGADADATEDNSELWLNRIDSDIKVLLRNKFYIEGIMHEE